MIDLKKKTEERTKTIINLKKNKGIGNQKARVAAVLDYSGSMGTLYQKGIVQETVERLLPIGLAFDDDGEVDTYLFHHDFIKLEHTITLDNLEGYVDREVIKKGYRMGSTNYAPVLREILKVYGNDVDKGGFFSKDKLKPAPIPTYVIVFVDGGNDDRTETKEIITKLSEHGIFIQFVGLGNADFSFLERLDDLKGRKIDNVNFFAVSDIRSLSDDQLYDKVFFELPSWLKDAESAGIILPA